MIKRFTALALALFVMAPLAAQTLEQRHDAVAEFKRYFRKYKEASQKVEAIHTLQGMECVEAVLQLVELLDHKEPDVRAAAMEVVATYRDAETFQGLIDELPKLKDQKQRALWIEVLGNAKIAKAQPVLSAIVLEDRRATAAVKYRIARALGKIGRPEAAAALRVLLQDSDALVRLAASDSVGQLALTELADGVIALLEDRAWQVQSSAVSTVGILRPPAAISPLIELMKKGGRLKEETAEALFLITALDFGVDPAMWERQWEQLQSIGWRIPTAEELAKAKEARKRSDAYYGVAGDTTSFGGITTTSTRVLFIIDVSGSMDELVVERERFDAGYSDYRKLTIVKTELSRTLDSLGQDTIFNIVAFASDLKLWKKYLVPANIVNKSSAQAWVKRLKSLGGNEAQELAAAGLGGAANLAAGKTNTYKALMHAFGIDPAVKVAPLTGEKVVLKSKLDTVFFLSDGRPSTGKLVDTREILESVTETNQLYKIVFHTIAIGDFQKDFLRALAGDNGGVFVDLGR